MKNYIAIIFVFLTHLVSAQEINYIQMSKKFIEAASDQSVNTDSYLKIFANADENVLRKQLDNDDAKKAFFINLYNGFTNNTLKKNPEQYKDRGAFFKSQQFVIAGNKVSLDIIEHGFLRRSSIKWSLGRFHKLFPSKLDRKFRVKKVDYRIHFSLNCGAKSCPMIAAYDKENINAQLDQSTAAYLNSNSKYDAAKNVVYVPSLMSWFRGDFGNKRGIWKITENFKIIPKDSKPNIEYNSYDWTLYLDNFKK